MRRSAVSRCPFQIWRHAMTRRTLDTGTKDLLVHVEDGVAVLTMNRPERRNALSGAMLTAMSAALAGFETDSEVACIVLTGAGGAFCAGGDVKGMAEGAGGGSTAAAGTDLDSRIHAQRVSQRATAGRLFKMPKPRIASLPGAAAGASLSLALACDLRIASEKAVMTTAFAKVGFSGDYGVTYVLSQLVGTEKAYQINFLSARTDTGTALRLGLVKFVVPGGQLEAETLKLARRLARGPRVAYRYMTENINRAASGADVDNCLELEATHHVHTGF